jgi:hypothetical protein
MNWTDAGKKRDANRSHPQETLPAKMVTVPCEWSKK